MLRFCVYAINISGLTLYQRDPGSKSTSYQRDPGTSFQRGLGHAYQEKLYEMPFPGIWGEILQNSDG
jgi:hypothetical protein